MVALARTLRANGHRVRDWGLGRNSGQVDRLLSALRQRVGALVEELGEPLIAVGWSLGGYLAREVAREIPERFVKVITLGSPIVGGPRYTAAAHWYRSRGFDLDEIEREVAERYRRPLTVPVVAIYSKRDGIVAWQACIDHWSPHVRHVEVGSTHLGMAFCPQVLDLVSEEVGAA
jgi:pimeloyl-ACP methyl ester carboxylesterase